MEGEKETIVIVDESRFDLVFYGVGLAAELRALVGNFDRLAVFILPLVGDLVGLGLPLPCVSKFEDAGDLPVPGVADRIDCPVRIEAVGFDDLLENWWLLCRRRCSKNKDQHAESQKTGYL